MNLTQQERFHYLDSLRGLAALAVFFSHLIGAFGLPNKLMFLQRSPIRIFWHGEGAVFFFFLLSGFVLTKQLDNSKDMFNLKSLFEYALLRINRIYPSFAFILITSYFLRNRFISDYSLISFSSDWIIGISKVSLSFSTLIKELSVIFNVESAIRIIPISWTLSSEIVISICMPILYFVCKKNWLVGLVFFYYSTKFLGIYTFVIIFIIGIVIYLQRNKIINSIKPLHKFLKVLILFFGILLFTFPFYIQTPWVNKIASVLFIHSILPGCVVLFILVLSSTSIQKILTNNWLQFLGKISYSLYLTHFTFLLLVSYPMIVYVNKIAGTNLLFVRLTTYIALTIGTLCTASAFYYLFEHPLHIKGKKLIKDYFL